ncbi:MAG: glycosyltransferase [Bacteroidetes bacterium]|nr:glycosyltransferase [Bacteroidota bacterium]
MNNFLAESNSIREYFDGTAKGYRPLRRQHRYYWQEIFEQCNYFSHETFRVLELGSGGGELVGKIKGIQKAGIEISPELVKIAQANFTQVNFITGDAEEVQAVGEFDLIIISNLIGYSHDIQHLFETVKHYCHDNTKIIVTYYNNLWEPFLKFAELIGLKERTPIQNWLSHRDIKNILSVSGFDVYRESRKTLVPFNIPLVSWFFNRFLVNLPLINRLALNKFSFAKLNRLVERDQVQDKYSVSIVIPARNESGNLRDVLQRIPRFGKFQEVIFIEGNSTDDTWEVIEGIIRDNKTHFRLKSGKQPGKGKYDAVRMGFDMAEGDILMILDADLTVSPEDLPKFYNAIATGTGDFINGTRLVYAMEKQAMRFLNMLGNRFFSAMFSWLLGQHFTDTLCGTKVMFRADYIRLVTNRKFFGDFDPFGDFDLIFGAYKLNLKIVEVPIRYKERKYGTTTISRFRNGLILLKMCVFAARKIKFR